MININIVSNEGHTILQANTAEEAVKLAVDAANDQKKWIYVGPNFVSPTELTPGMLANDEDITLTNPLVGG